MLYLDKLPKTSYDVARMIDHTILKPEAVYDEIVRVATEGRQICAASVCVNPAWISEVAHILQGSETVACSVAGFPLGASLPETIAAEAELAITDGAKEIDMVIPIGLAKMGRWDKVKESVKVVKKAIGDNILKVILEVCQLSEAEIKAASYAALEGNADFLKTSTGFSCGGATIEAVRIMADVAGDRAGIKAAGGIKNYDDLVEMVKAGATRIGASAGVSIVNEARKVLGE